MNRSPSFINLIILWQDSLKSGICSKTMKWLYQCGQWWSQPPETYCCCNTQETFHTANTLYSTQEYCNIKRKGHITCKNETATNKMLALASASSVHQDDKPVWWHYDATAMTGQYNSSNRVTQQLQLGNATTATGLCKSMSKNSISILHAFYHYYHYFKVA